MISEIQDSLGGLIFKIGKEFGKDFIKQQIINYRESKRRGFLKRYYRFCEKIKK